MRVLIVEDSTFNAFCLTRLLQVVCQTIHVTVVNDSLQALAYLEKNRPTLIILDGDLKALDGLGCNGPALAHTIWAKHADLPIIAWTNSDLMRQAFADVFRQYGKSFCEHTCWNKIVSPERIVQSLSYLVSQDINPRERANIKQLYV
ncbi:two component sensor and regulator, histidine kinase response regulator [Legionella beliardensis]|uniref:Two component sensor and regulator, histidine kinase response regulator n=1 Tax=Legionella beliardensis TaxID=91822 RepID=A0A378HXU0_9GAMM|nr:response regulator [Legionella beliardensis]STX27632.1 two component sensor and regulator, histidine kinase response regulator [Legionella beliardensis]